MHELALCENLIRIIEDQAEAQDYDRVRRVTLQVGALACVEPEALRFSFDLVARGTRAEGAALEILETRPEAWCPACERAVAVRQRFEACPDCGEERLRLRGGDELRVTELEVD